MAVGCQHLPDIEALLAPISEERPCGEDLRYDTAFDVVQAAMQHCLRCEAGLVEDESQTKVQADWRAVIQRGGELLVRRTKDLRIAVWVARALASQDGFAGLVAGLALLRRLLEDFWEGLYPLDAESEPDTLDLRAAPLEALVVKDSGLLLPNLLHELALVPSAGEQRMSLNFRKRGMRPQQRSGEDESAFLERVQQAEEYAKEFAQAVSDAEPDVVAATYQDVKTALEEIDSLNRVMHERFGSRSPGVSALRQALEEVEAALRGIARDKGVLDVPAPEAETDGQADEQPAAAAARSGAAGPISSRDDAYRRLEEVARYLRMHDRHSPVPLLLQKILSWKDLPFDQLLREIVRDANARAQAYELLGVRDASEDSS